MKGGHLQPQYRVSQQQSLYRNSTPLNRDYPHLRSVFYLQQLATLWLHQLFFISTAVSMTCVLNFHLHISHIWTENHQTSRGLFRGKQWGAGVGVGNKKSQAAERISRILDYDSRIKTAENVLCPKPSDASSATMTVSLWLQANGRMASQIPPWPQLPNLDSNKCLHGTGCWREYLELINRQKHEPAENCTRRNCIPCTLHSIWRWSTRCVRCR
jgi:hypothetical protein